MAKIELNVPETVTFKRAGEVRTFALSSLPVAMIERLVIHGLTQKVGDAAAGKAGDEATAKMQAVYEALRAGEWGRERGAGAEPVDPVEKIMWNLCMTAARKALKAKGVAWKTVTDEAKDAIFAEHGEKFRAAAVRQIAEDAANAALLGDL